MSSEETRIWTPEDGLSVPEVRNISWNNFLLNDENYLGKWRTDSGVRVTPETSLQSTVVLSCCRILSETVGSLPIHIYRRLPDGGEEIAREIPLYKVLSFSPNEWQTKGEFFEQLMMALTLWGNSYTRVRSGLYGSVSFLDNLNPGRMEVRRLENGRLRYEYTNPETGKLELYRQDQIMHIRWTPEQDGMKGMVPVEVSREAIGLARACEQHAARFWANSARPGVVLTTDGTLSAEAAERLRDNWERIHRGSERAYRTAVLTGGIKATELGFTNEASQFTATRAAQTEEIARVYRVPLHLIQGTSGGDIETQGQEFVTYTLTPWLHRIESAISRSLIHNDDEFTARFDVRGLLRANSTARASYYSTMTALGVMTINDVRRAEGMRPVPHGDHHFVAMNMTTLEEAVKPKPEMPPPGGGAPPPAAGGPPSLPEVKTGKAPIASPKGEGSEPKMEEAVEENTADWEDAVEDRAFCPTGSGGGIDNSCGVAGGITAGHESLKEWIPFSPIGNSRNSDYARIPSDEEFSQALIGSNESKGTKIGAAKDLPAGTPVALRIDIPAFNWSRDNLGKSIYAITVHENKGGKQFGQAIGYEPIARLAGPVTFAAKESDAEKVATGERSKYPLATVKGNFSPGREIPADIDTWTPVGYDPKKAAYFYDKRTGREVTGGTDAVSVGNTVFVRMPKYGDRHAQHQYRSAADSWGLEQRAFCPTGEGGGLDNSCAAGGGGVPDVLRAPKADHSWLDAHGEQSWASDTLRRAPPVTGGHVLNSFKINDVDDLKDAMYDVGGFESLDDLVTMGGGVRKGGDITIKSHGDHISVESEFPVAKNGSARDGIVSVKTTLYDNGVGPSLSYDSLMVEGVSPNKAGMKARLSSLVLERMTDSMLKAEQMGISIAETMAAGRATGSLKGYRLWPQFGFDGDVPKTISERARDDESLPADVREKASAGVLTVQQLIETRPGEIWWDENGGPTALTFDFEAKDSLGYKRFERMKAKASRLKNRNASRSLLVYLEDLATRAFCPTGDGGGIDNSCSDEGGPASGDKGSASKSGSGCPAPCHEPDVHSDTNEDGVTDSARVGVPAFDVPPPPGIGRVPNLGGHQRAVEDAFISHFENDPDKVCSQFRELVVGQGDPPTFGTDDAKCLTDAWSHPDPDVRAENRATLNTALHQCANAIAKRAFLQHLDTLSEGDEIMVTVGGCGAGKGFALKNVPAAMEMKQRAKVVWDSAGDQNATENPWILKEAQDRGLKVNYVFVHADPFTQWADPDRGVVKRASDPKDGRMVDARVFADSYAIGAKNHHAFHQANKDNKSASFVFLDNTGKPKQVDGVPQDALALNPDKLAEFAEKKVEESSAPPRVKSGALLGRKIWPKQKKARDG